MLKNIVYSLRNKSVRNFSRVYLNKEKTLSYDSVHSDDKRERDITLPTQTKRSHHGTISP